MKPHEFWQEIYPAEHAIVAPFTDMYPARLPDGRVLFLPIRPLPETSHGIASLILNQSSFAVETELADVLTGRLRTSAPDIIVGMPTLGLSLARLVAQRLGHTRFLALGNSRKFWYQDDLSVPLTSITSPGAQKRLYLDPRMIPLLEGTRVCLIDDVISSGTSIASGLDLLAKVDVTPVSIGAAMLQTDRWEGTLSRAHARIVARVCGAIETPLLSASGEGWVADL